MRSIIHFLAALLFLASVLDWLSHDDMNLMEVESIALDPSDPIMLFMACGTYTNINAPNGAILWSENRGKTFHPLDVPFKMGGNENGRGTIYGDSR